MTLQRSENARLRKRRTVSRVVQQTREKKPAPRALTISISDCICHVEHEREHNDRQERNVELEDADKQQQDPHERELFVEEEEGSQWGESTGLCAQNSRYTWRSRTFWRRLRWRVGPAGTTGAKQISRLGRILLFLASHQHLHSGSQTPRKTSRRRRPGSRSEDRPGRVRTRSGRSKSRGRARRRRERSAAGVLQDLQSDSGGAQPDAGARYAPKRRRKRRRSRRGGRSRWRPSGKRRGKRGRRGARSAAISTRWRRCSLPH